MMKGRQVHSKNDIVFFSKSLFHLGYLQYTQLFWVCAVGHMTRQSCDYIVYRREVWAAKYGVWHVFHWTAYLELESCTQFGL